MIERDGVSVTSFMNDPLITSFVQHYENRAKIQLPGRIELSLKILPVYTKMHLKAFSFSQILCKHINVFCYNFRMKMS